MNIRRAGRLATKVALGAFLHVARKFLEGQLSLSIKQTLPLQISDFGVDPFHACGYDLAIELVHFARIVQIGGFDCDRLSPNFFLRWAVIGCSSCT